MDGQKIRLNKFLAERLGCSRREADAIIQSGKVSVNQKVATLGDRIDKTDKVWYNEKIVPFEAEYFYLAFHKPVGYVCSRRAQGSAPTLYRLLPAKYRLLKTVGRLDKDSSGLILLTNDGDFAFQMTHPKFRKTKVYEVELDHPLEPLHQQMISDYGVMLEDGISKFKVIASPFDVIKDDTSAGNGYGGGSLLSSRGGGGEQPAGSAAAKTMVAGDAANEGAMSAGDGCGGGPPPSLRGGGGERPAGPAEKKATAAARFAEAKTAESIGSWSSRTRLTVVLTEGRNRQIRRTFAALGYRVTRLHRTSFGKYELGNLPSGKYAIIEP